MAASDIVYPTKDDVYNIHETIIESDPDAERGTLQGGSVEFAIDYIRDGYFGEVPQTIHEKAAHLMRLLASNHEFSDGNKRTALGTTASFYLLNGYYFDYEDEEIRTLLRTFAVIERVIDIDAVAVYFEECVQGRDAIENDVFQAEIDHLLEDKK